MEQLKGVSQTHNKLVREHMPRILRERGIQSTTKKLKETELRPHLKLKLLEEVNEFIKDGDPHELTDILQAVRDLGKTYDLTPEVMENRRVEKEALRGGFSAGIFLIETIEPE